MGRGKPGAKVGRVDVSEPASISAGIADRYATAIFEIAEENKSLDSLESGISDLSAALNESEDFRTLIQSPLIARSEQRGAIMAIAEKMGLEESLKNALGLMADRRRLFVLPQLLRALRERIATSRGEVTADVITAQELSADQKKKLAETLKANVGKTVTLNTAVDESLIGGMIVQVGSKMIDTSIRSKLSQLQNAMKEVG